MGDMHREAIAKVLERFPQALLHHVEHDIQIYVTLLKFSSSMVERRVIKALEKALKAEVDQRIEVYLPAVPDKLRRDRTGLKHHG